MIKKCSVCNLNKDVSLFNAKKDGYQSKCRDCQKEYYKKYYRSNDKEKTRLLARNKQQKQYINNLIDQAKDVPCLDCNQKFLPCAMDFDHLTDKEFNISTYKHRVSVSRLLKEMAKCEIVCAVCHRIRTFNRQSPLV